jgi:hypothetical protein
MLTNKLWIFMRIDKFFSLIWYYSFIFGLLWISIGLSVFGFVGYKYQQIAIQLLLTIRNILWATLWAIKVILKYLPLPILNHFVIKFSIFPQFTICFLIKPFYLVLNNLFHSCVNTLCLILKNQYWTGLFVSYSVKNPIARNNYWVSPITLASPAVFL